MKNQKGFSVIEIILACAIFVIFSTGAIVAILSSFSSNRLGEEQTIASQYASEGIEAVRSIKNQAFENLVNTSATGIERISNLWAFSGTSNQFGPTNKYTRVISIGDVQRDVDGNIVESGGTVDPLTKKITSTVSWNFSSTRSNSVVLSAYLSDWRKAIIGDWTNPNSLIGSVNLTGNNAGIKIQIQGNYAYIIDNSGGNNFSVIDISNPSGPLLVGSLKLTGSQNNLFVKDDYVYVASSDNQAELKIVNISNPSSPNEIGSLNISGNGDANGIYIVGTVAYLVTDDNGASGDFKAINVSSPASPSLLGSLDLSGNQNDVFVLGSYAYVASGSDNRDLQVVNIINPSSPSLATYLDLPGNSDADSIAGGEIGLMVGQGDNLRTISIVNPASPAYSGSYNAGDNINDITFDSISSYAFLATSNSSSQLQIINVGAISSPVQVGNYDAVGSPVYNGVAYDQSTDRAYIVTNIGSSEFVVISP